MKLDEYLFKNRKAFNATSFANQLGISKSYLSKLVNGTRKPSVKLAKKIDTLTNNALNWQELVS